MLKVFNKIFISSLFYCKLFLIFKIFYLDNSDIVLEEFTEVESLDCKLYPIGDGENDFTLMQLTNEQPMEVEDQKNMIANIIMIDGSGSMNQYINNLIKYWNKIIAPLINKGLFI